MNIVTGKTEFFPNIEKIGFEGRESDNPLAFKWYNEDAVVGGKTMKETLRFAVAYWHSFCNGGADPFGAPPRPMPWNEGPDADTRAKNKMDAAFEFITKIGAPFYCFHDMDIIEEGASFAETTKRLETMVAYAKEK